MRYFKPEEFACPCGCGLGYDNMYKPFLVGLDIARGHAGVPFVLTSARRCVAHNRAIGGATESAHLLGKAVDIATPDSHTRYKILRALLGAGFNRIGIGKDFIHCDVNTSATSHVIWRY